LGQARRRSTEWYDETKREFGLYSLSAADNQPVKRKRREDQLRRLQKVARKIKHEINKYYRPPRVVNIILMNRSRRIAAK